MCCPLGSSRRKQPKVARGEQTVPQRRREPVVRSSPPRRDKPAERRDERTIDVDAIKRSLEGADEVEVLERPPQRTVPQDASALVVVQAEHVDEPMAPLKLDSRDPPDIVGKCRTLLRLEVRGAEPPDAGRHWAVVDDACEITVTAVTDPDDGSAWSGLDWDGAAAKADKHEAVVSRTATRSGQDVSATLDGVQKTVPVEVVDLLDVAAPGLKVLGTRHWKAYESATPARLVATVSPAEDWVRGHLQWQGAAAGSGTLGEGAVDLAWPLAKAADSTAEERAGTVVLGTVCPKSIPVKVRVCRWPKLDLVQVNFGGYEVRNDGVAEIGVAFDRRWRPGRADPAANQAAATRQSPLCFVRGSTVQLNAHFQVMQQPTETETVRIRGRAVHRGVTMDWEQDVTVNPGDAYVSFPTATASAALANEVDASRLTIDWTMNSPDNATPHQAIGQSDNLLYVLLGAPHNNARLYLTLLDMSCRGAAGAQTVDALVTGAFEPLKTTVGDGQGLVRKGDGKRLTYYATGTNTAANNTVWVTHDILGSAAATARCGGWKDMLLHTYRMHGVTAPRGLACVRRTHDGANDYAQRFLVSKQAFTGRAGHATAAPYTHRGGDIDPDTDIRGQGKHQPQFEFGDHVVVWHNDAIYDPSYGLVVAAPLMADGLPDALAYETAGIGGFGHNEGNLCYSRTSTDGTPQQFAVKTGAGALITCTATAGQMLDDIVAAHADRIYTKEADPAQRRTLLRAALHPTVGDGPFLAGRKIHMPQPRTQIVLKWSWS